MASVSRLRVSPPITRWAVLTLLALLHGPWSAGDSGVNVLAGALRRRPLASLAVGGARSVAWAAGTGVHFTSDRISKRGRRYVGERAAPYGLRVMHAV